LTEDEEDWGVDAAETTGEVGRGREDAAAAAAAAAPWATLDGAVEVVVFWEFVWIEELEAGDAERPSGGAGALLAESDADDPLRNGRVRKSEVAGVAPDDEPILLRLSLRDRLPALGRFAA
jgi:hypothetical protein